MAKQMSATTKDVLKCVLVLVAIALVAGILLGVVNKFTYVDVNAVMLTSLSEKFDVAQSSVKSDNSYIYNKSEDSYVERCYVVYKEVDGTTTDEIEALVYLVVGSGAYSGSVEMLYTVKDGKIADIEVYSHSETSGIGTKVLKQENLNKYKGIELSSITNYNIAGGADAKGDALYVSGATRTTRGVLNSLRALAYSYNTYVAREAAGE